MPIDNDLFGSDPKEYGLNFPVGSIRRQIDQIFDDLLNPAGSWEASASGSFAFRPDAEIESEGRFTIIRLELPGVDASDVTVTAFDTSIVVSGQKVSRHHGSAGENFRSERSFGAFSRSFTMPFPVDAGRVEARLDKGVLEVTLPRPTDIGRPARRVPIRA